MSLLQTSYAKFAATVAGGALVLAMAFAFAAPAHAALSESQIQSILSLLQSFGADASTVGNVEASLRGQAPTGGSSSGGSTSGASCSQFTRDLTVGSTGSDVQALQVILNANGAQVAASGAGSPGSESTYFGSLTQSALAKWQAAHGVSPAAGYFGPLTRAALASSGACGAGTGTGTGTTVPAGTGLTVSAGSQPQNSLAPQNASRVPFTRFILTAGNDGAVTVNSVTVQRVGLGQNSAFDGVVLLDQDGNQLGTAKTFNSNDQATIGETITIPAGQSRTFTVAGNMAADNSLKAGEAPAMSVVAVNTSATVSGSLPITGAYHTINATLTVGTLSLDTSNAFAANSTLSKEIGTTAQRVTGFRLTAGSAEDVLLKTLRFNQTGSASTQNDITNIQVVVAGTAYPVTLSADGRYVTANLGGGVLITEGNNVDVYVQYDIIGGNATGRTIIFDVDETTDIYGVGSTYGYGISPTTSGGSSVPSSRGNTTETTGTPYIYANQITISGASVTTIAKANSVAAQNVAINVPNQPLGGFTTDLKGEGITVQQLNFGITISGTGEDASDLTNVTLVDENGTVVAGPVDGTSSGIGVDGYIRFSDSVTFPTGMHTYTLRGKLSTDFDNDDTIIASTTPNSTYWTNAKGAVTGKTVSLPGSDFSMNTMTVKAASLVVGRANSPASQTIVAGGTAVHMISFTLDATQSGEDVRLSSFYASSTADTSNLNTLSSCQLFDGATALNTGSNVINPSGAANADTDSTFTFDSPITVAKGTVKTLGLKCNVSSSASGTYEWDHSTLASFSSTGATSGSSVTPTAASDSAVIVTVSTGSVTVDDAASTPSYALASAGATDVTIGVYKFRASNEALNLNKLGLQLTNTASSTAGDINNNTGFGVTIWDGATKVGTAYFTGSNTTATSTLSQTVVLPKDQDKELTIKANLADVGTGQSVTFSGHLLAVDYLNAEGTGVSSGSTQQLGASAGSTSVAGVRISKSFPTVAKGTLSSTGIADGELMRFSITADAKGPVGVSEFNLKFATTSVTLSNVKIYAYTDSSYSTPVSGIGAGGAMSDTGQPLGTTWVSGSTSFEFTAHNGTASTTIQVPANGTRYFLVKGDVAGVQSGSSITTTLLGDSAFHSTSAGASANPLLQADGVGKNFIWSPNSTTTAVIDNQDWTGGYGVSGLPSTGLTQTRSQ